MAMGSIGTNPYSQLQSALESARQRTSVQQELPKADTVSPRTPRSESNGSLYQKLYGQTERQPKTEPTRLGSRFDMYA